MDEASEPMAVEIVAQGVIGKRVDEMESGFMMALDYMIQIADKDHDEQVLDENLDGFIYNFTPYFVFFFLLFMINFLCLLQAQ